MAGEDGPGLAPLPPIAAWRHHGAREGFEVARFTPMVDGVLIQGSTSAVEDGRAWWVSYVIEVDDGWVTRRARIDGGSESGDRHLWIAADGHGRWLVDSEHDPRIDGCLDIDLESSACTNTVPVHRMALAPGESVPAPAAYVRADDLSVDRLDQDYERPRRPPSSEEDADGSLVLDYSAPRFDYDAPLVFDASGLIVDYPGLATRVR